MRPGSALLADVAGIGVFAAVGRASHAEVADPLGLVQTAWPFLAGWAVGVLAVRGWRRPASWRSGVTGWIGAVAGGMLLRAATGAGVQPSFVVVATVVLAILLLGWRSVVVLVRRSRRRVLTV